MVKPYIVGIGGTVRSNSSTERAVSLALECVRRDGAEVRLISGKGLELPLYNPDSADRTDLAKQLIEEVRRADGLIVATPGYHGGISGLVKNALDYLEDLRADRLPYLEGKAVGCIVTAAGWQGATGALISLRSVVHALRGWPTPLGICINSTELPFEADGACNQPQLLGNFAIMSRELVAHAVTRRRKADVRQDSLGSSNRAFAGRSA